MAWKQFATPVAAEFAQSYLARRRGIDLVALREFSGGEPVVGYAGTGWTTLVSRLRDQGISDDELIGTDLAQITRSGRVVDTYRGRIIVPVTNSASRINGFVGRDVTGDDRAPKYRNPTRTSTFNKSTILYRPTHQRLAADANVVIVEGVLDALAIAASAARRGKMDHFAPCTTSGVTASHEQVCRVLALHGRPPVIALDGDQAGAEGTGRWLSGLCLENGRPALVTTLPAGTDSGLTAFDRRGSLRNDDQGVRPSLPGRELVRLLADRHSQPVAAVLASLVPLAAQLPPEPAARLLREAEQEVSRLGWNPNGSFTRALTDALPRARAGPQPPAAGSCAHPHLTGPALHRSTALDFPCLG